MNQSRLIAISLTLLMLLLVLFAAFIFTFQSQNKLETRVASLQTNALALEGTATRITESLSQAEATQTAAAYALATVEADGVALEGQLVARQQEIERLNGELLIAQSTLLTATTDLTHYADQLAQPPQVAVTLLDTAVAPDEPARLWIAASDAVGLARVDVEVSGFTTSYPAAGSRLFTRQITQTIGAAGTYTLTVTAMKQDTLLYSSSRVILTVITPTITTTITPSFFPMEETAVFRNDPDALGWVQQPTGIAFFWQKQWDDEAALTSFTDAYIAYASRRYRRESVEQPDGGLCWQGSETTCLFLQNNTSLIVTAPDVETAVFVAASIP